MKQLIAGFLGCLFVSAIHGQNSWTNIYRTSESTGLNAICLDLSGDVYVTGYAQTFADYDFATIKYSATTGTPVWTNYYVGPGVGFVLTKLDVARAIAADTNGHVFVTGDSMNNAGNMDYATVAYTTAGVPLWTNRYDGGVGLDDRPKGMVADKDGNVLVTGRSPNSQGGSDCATVKYSSNGVPLWTQRYSGPDNSSVAVAVDGSGNAYVTGASATQSFSPYNYDFFTLKYSPAGLPLWTNRYGSAGGGYDAAQALALDTNDNVFVTGNTSQTNGRSAFATIKYSNAGSPVWTNFYASSSSTADGDGAVAMAVDGEGNVVVSGTITGSPFNNNDFVTVKYSNAGLPLWTNRYNGPVNSNDVVWAMVADRRGNVFVTGSSFGTNRTSDYLTIKYSASGIPLWTNRYDGQPGETTDTPSGIAVNNAGDAFVTGGSYLFNSESVTIKYGATPEPPVGILSGNGSLGFNNGQFGFDISGPAGTSVVIQGSTNFQNWVPLQTNQLGGSTHFSDVQSPNFRTRSYRVVPLP